VNGLDEIPREKVLYWFTVFGPAKRANLETYLELTVDFRETQESAASRMGVSLRTTERWKADIRAAVRAAKEAAR
jgi:hypothetical protein